MTNRMASMETMIAAPPSVTTQRARRSNRRRRTIFSRGTITGRVVAYDSPGATTLVLSFMEMLSSSPLERLAQFFLGNGVWDRKKSVLDHDLLSLLREHKLHELTGEGIKALAWRDRKSTRLNSSHHS